MLVVVLFWITIFTFEDERNFLRDPPSGVPFHFESDSMYPVALATLQEDKNLSKMRFQLVPKKWVCATLHYLCLVNTITTLIWQNVVSLFYNLIVYFTTKMSWSNCPLLRFSFLTQIIVCIYTLGLNQNQSKIISK